MGELSAQALGTAVPGRANIKGGLAQPSLADLHRSLTGQPCLADLHRSLPGQPCLADLHQVSTRPAVLS